MNYQSMNDTRKRPFNVPQSKESRDRHYSQSSDGSAVSQDSSKMVNCRLCNNRSFKTTEDFDLHLTMIHFRDQLSDRLGRFPYSCELCGFTPTADDPNEEMIIHYGCKERLAMKFYQDECSRLPPPQKVKKPSEPVKDSSRSSNGVGRSQKVKEIDMFDKKVVNPSKISCDKCKGKKMTFVTAKSLKIHLIQTHYFPNVGIGHSKIRCPKCKKDFREKTEFTKHFLEYHFERYSSSKESERASSDKKPAAESLSSLERSLAEEANSPQPLPKTREMKTIHGPPRERNTLHHRPPASKKVKHEKPSDGDSRESTSQGGARQRMLDKWKSTSIDSQKFELEKLQDQMESMKTDHREALKKKAQDFERWISQKEKLLEDEICKRQEVERTVEEANVDIADLKKQLEQKDLRISGLEEVVVEEHDRYSEIKKEKDDLEKKLTTQDVLGKELCEFQGYIDKMKAESKDLKSQLNSKSDELVDQQELIEKLKSDHEKQLSRLNKQLETWKGKHEKVLDEKKEKMAHIKEITKLHKELESDQKNQLARVMKENEELKQECENASIAEKELAGSKLAKKVKALEAEKKDNESTVKLLETQRNALLDSLDRVQKIMQGFESVIKDKNEKIQDLSIKLEEADINLEEAMQKINTSKANDKEKKESQKVIKQLQSSLQEFESRQFTNAKLISGMQKEKQVLEKRLKDYEERVEVRKLEQDLKGAKNHNEKQEQEIAKQQALLRSKTNELFEISDKLTSAQTRVRQLEREIRHEDGGSGGKSLSDEEHEELKRTISTLSARYSQVKEENKRLEASARSSDTSEVTKLKAQIETLKRVAHDSQTKLSRKEKEVEKLQLLVNESRNVGIKKEPIEVDSEGAIIMNAADPVITTEDPDPILVNTADSTVVNSPHLSDPDPYEFNVDVDVDIEGTDTDSSKKSIAGKKRKSSSKIQDVTNQYNEEEDEIVCGICEGYDPPLPEDGSGRKDTYTTSWVGCDCGRWYHKECTNLKRFSAAFSCKSVRRKCQKIPSAEQQPQQPKKQQQQLPPLLPLQDESEAESILS